jgi:hypothetical protein
MLVDEEMVDLGFKINPSELETPKQRRRKK